MGPNFHPQPTSRRTWTRRGALAAVVLASVAAGCGTSSEPATDVAGPAAPTATVGIGSDQHLLNLVAEAATPATGSVGSDQHLLNLAAEAATPATGSVGSDQHLLNLAAEAASVSTG